MSHVSRTFLSWMEHLYTGYFASVMATGIVSIALFLSHATQLSTALLVIGCFLLAFLVVVYLWRLVQFPHATTSDLSSAGKVFTFFTIVAAFGVMATRFSLSGMYPVTVAFTLVAACVWIVLIYWAFAVLLVKNEMPLTQSVNGAWLTAIVGTESLAITWVLLDNQLPVSRDLLQLLSYMFWTVGILLYIVFIVFIVYRFLFGRNHASDLTPPYWINMGAMAITTVAGTRLLLTPTPGRFLISVRPLIEGLTVAMWAWGTWWIPLLLIIGIWKTFIAKVPLRYDPALWSMVFPLGMYATAVQLLAKFPGLTVLAGIGPPCTWIAFTVWVIVGLGWLWSIRTALTTKPATAVG